MGINRPTPGKVLNCNFTDEAVPPEMTGSHYCIVISKKRVNNHKLCVVVPITSSQSSHTPPWHLKLDHKFYPFLNRESWAKADLVRNVSFNRLTDIPEDQGGLNAKITQQDLHELRNCILRMMGLDDLPSISENDDKS